MTSTFTEYVYEDRDYTLEEYVDQFEGELPQLVCVTQGYCSENADETLDKGQVTDKYTYQKF